MSTEHISVQKAKNTEATPFEIIQEAASTFRSLKDVNRLQELALLYTLLEASGKATIFRDLIGLRLDYQLLDTIFSPLFQDLLLVLRKLSSVVDLLVRSQYVQRSDREKYYAQMVWILDKVQDELDEKIILPIEREYIKSFVIPKWKYLVLDAIKNLAGSVDIEIRLKSVEERSNNSFLLFVVTNNGDAVAENVRLTIKTPETTLLNLDNLPSQKETTVESKLGQMYYNGQRVEVVCTYDDLGAKDKSVEFDFVVTEPGLKKKFHSLVLNPYVVGRPLRMTNDLFFGRADILETIIQNVDDPNQSNIMMLVGERRTGKTSLLYKLRERLIEKNHFPVLIDLQSMIDPGDDAFLFDIAVTIAGDLQKSGYPFQAIKFEDFKGVAAKQFEVFFLPNVTEVLQSHKLILLVDEIAMLEKRLKADLSSPAIFSYLRSLMSHNEIRFVLAGTIDYSVISSSHWTELLNITVRMKIEYLTRSETYDLATLPVQDYLEIEELALEKIWEITAGHPFFVQLVCSRLVKLANEKELTHIGVQHVRTIVPEAIALGDIQLSDIWDDLSHDGQIILAIIGQLLTVKQIAIPSDIKDRHKSLEIRSDADTTLKELVGQGILQFDSGHYRYKVSLFGEWVAKYHPIENLL